MADRDYQAHGIPPGCPDALAFMDGAISFVVGEALAWMEKTQTPGSGLCIDQSGRDDPSPYHATSPALRRIKADHRETGERLILRLRMLMNFRRKILDDRIEDSQRAVSLAAQTLAAIKREGFEP